MLIENNSKLVMIGDSITDVGRARPIGEGRDPALGTGYVSLVNSLIETWQPGSRIRIVNMGTSGNTVRDLAARWQTDVIDLQPDWVSVMIGINDVWRQFDTPLQPLAHVYPDEYEATLNNLVTRTLPHVKGMVLMTPFYIEPNPADAMRARMDEYGALVKKVADAHKVTFIDMQAAFTEILQSAYPAALAWDRVHPGQTGHLLLARAFLNGIGFKWGCVVPVILS